MKKLLFPLLLALAVVAPAHAQVNCNQLVTLDAANVLHDPTVIAKAASGLIDQGADVHVVTINHTPPAGLTTTMQDLVTTCPSWKGKANLFVLIIAPTEHKKNVFFGAAYAPAFLPPGKTDVAAGQDAVNTIYSQAANPYYKSGDFSGGTAAALRDFSAKVAAYHDQQRHPPAATDLHGFYVFLYWGLVLLAFVLLCFFAWKWWAWLEKEHEAVTNAQSAAVAAKNRALSLYRGNPNENTTLSERLLDLTNSEKANPDTDGFSAQQYLAIRDLWDDFSKEIKPGRETAARTSPRHSSRWSPDFSSNRVPPTQKDSRVGTRYASTASAPSGNDYPARGGYTDTSSDPRNYVPTPQTVIIDHSSSSSDLLTGVLVGEALSRPEREEPRHYREPDPTPSSDSSSSDSSSFSSGSDSSWGDSSSSDFSSGSDSSW